MTRVPMTAPLAAPLAARHDVTGRGVDGACRERRAAR